MHEYCYANGEHTHDEQQLGSTGALRLSQIYMAWLLLDTCMNSGARKYLIGTVLSKLP